jgi:hypothetical protein
MKTILLKLSDEMFHLLNKKAPVKTRHEFILQAIQEKMNKKPSENVNLTSGS